MAEMQLHTTCDNCISVAEHARILQYSETEELLRLYDEEYQSQLLANVASSKCHMCTLFHANIPRLSEPFESGLELAIRVLRLRKDPLAVMIELVGQTNTDFKIYAGSLRVHEAGHGNIQIIKSSETWSPESLNCIQSWLNSCTSCHDTCSKPQGPKRLPLRLIDVHTAGTIQIQLLQKMGQVDFDQLRLSNTSGVRIVSTKSLSPDTEYLTLSHRWGSPPTILLSQETPFHLADDISPHLLKCAEATVFQHAIHVTRCLGFRYIWIDALCIMQDDAEEKRAEVMRMDDIYFNSKLNISAAEADTLRGLVFTRHPLVVNPCVTTAKVPGIQEDMSLYVFDEEFSLRLLQKPLSARGWVLQERILSPRIIHFTEDQVFWECWSLKASEVLPEGLPDEKETDWMYEYLFNESIGIDATIFDVRQIKTRWYDLVEDYSGTSLTLADDHLLAVSAVAKRFCSAMRIDPSEYLAGMWKDDLPLSLDWDQVPIPGRSGPAEDRPDLEMKYAPSWSWASVMASVSIPDRREDKIMAATEVVNINVARRSQNFFDGTNFCELRLRGPICKFRRHLQDGIPWIQVSEDKAFQEFEKYSSIRGDRSICIRWDTARRFTMDHYFFLNVARSSSFDEESGLILTRIAECGTYKRVGSFRIPLKSEYLGSKLENAFKGDFDTLGREDYLELDSDGKYTINLI